MAYEKCYGRAGFEHPRPPGDRLRRYLLGHGAQRFRMFIHKYSFEIKGRKRLKLKTESCNIRDLRELLQNYRN